MPWYIYAFIAAVGIALVGVIEKKTLEREHTVEYVSLFSLMKLVLFFLIFGAAIRWEVTPWQLLLLGTTGFLGAGAFLLIAKAFRRLEMSTVVPLLTFDPVLTALLAFLILGERLSWWQIFGIVCVFLGAYTLELRRHQKNPLAPLQRIWQEPGGSFALLGVLMFSASSVVDRAALQQVSPNTYLAYTLSFTTLLYVLLWLNGDTRRRPRLFLNVWLLILLAAVFHLTALAAQARAVSIAAVGLVVAVKRLSVLLDVVIGGRLLHEKNLWQKTLASVVMLIGVFFIVYHF